MSWFDAAGFASIAKSALKEAQRTIDKALDIKDDDPSHVPANTPVDPNNEDFFGTWGISNSGNVKTLKKQSSEETPKETKMSSSIWGSFTGSFFDNKASEKTAALNSLEDTTDIDTENFSRSKLVVDDSDSHMSASENTDVIDMSRSESSPSNSLLIEVSLDSSENNPVVKRREKSVPQINRLSIVSCESGKNSGSESVDVITCSTECTTSPDSEVLSLGHSISTSSSALGLKPTSDSFEILGESITSPSSVEVIGSDSTNSRRQSQLTDEFVSPLDSPWSEDKSSSIEKISPESVEVIPEDQDENSVAEDTMSYTSISESTSATVLDTALNLYTKPQKMLKDTYNRVESLNEAIITEMTPSTEKNYNFVGDAITRAPCRSAMHLPLTQVNQVLIDTQPQSNKQDMPIILQNTNIIDIPQEQEFAPPSSETQVLETSVDEGSQSDKTLSGNDNLMESSSDTSTTTETSSHSSYLKNMLADAMVEKSFSTQQNVDKASAVQSKQGSLLESVSLSQIDLMPRESSPLSSESRSDLVKIGSDQTSGHTSGDDLETTTSSDIEIISSPNGDSSSTHSRQSPAKQIAAKSKNGDSTIDTLLCKMTMKKNKGHTRELSEASSISDDSHSSEDRLLKRISEMTDILESREFKIADVNRRNAELQELNNDLKLQLDSIITKQLETADLSQVTEEYTQRLSALEKKFQQAIREKDSLRKQLDAAKQEAASRLSKAELETLISDKDEIIKELREEGEKLSKQQLQHSNIIKKLRAKEKENESTFKHLRESIDNLSSESERLKKSLAAKEEVERTQIEAVHQLTTKNKKLESELAKLKEQQDDLTQKYDTVKKSLDAAKKELIDKSRASSELQVREQMMEALENQKKMTESQNEEILNQLEDLRYKLRQAEDECGKIEQKYRKENNELMLRLEEAEARNEELSQSILEVSKPLVRQLESLQATHTMKVAAFEKAEEELSLKIRELQAKLQASTTTERAAKEECISLRSKFAEMQGLQTSSSHRIEMLQMQLQQQQAEKMIAVDELNSKIDELNSIIIKNEAIIADQQKRIALLQQDMALEKTNSEVERRQMEAVQEQRDRGDPTRHSPRAESSSPTLSLGKGSVSDSMASSFWSQDEPFDMSHPPRYTNVFEMQTLQSNLKQREGELQQLQWELNRREQERSLLNSEISTLLTRVEDLETKTKEYDAVSAKLKELEQQYEALCQLYGEKVEENEELKLDLQDVKEMYKAQIDELLRQQKQARVD